MMLKAVLAAKEKLRIMNCAAFQVLVRSENVSEHCYQNKTKQEIRGH